MSGPSSSSPPVAGGRILAAGPDGTRWLVADPAGDRVVWVLAAEVAGRQPRRRLGDELRSLRAVPPEPGWSPVVDAGLSDDGAPWLVRVGSGTTALTLLGGGPRPRGVVAELVAAVADGLDHLARHHGAHGGVRPVAIALDGDGDRPDVRIAEPVPASLAPRLLPLDGCTPPERLEGAAPSVAGDVYGLAATATVLLTGRAPWRGAPGQGPTDVLLGLLADPTPGLAAADLDRTLLAALVAALAVDPDRRPTLDELVDAVGRRSARPEAAPPPRSSPATASGGASSVDGTVDGTVDNGRVDNGTVDDEVPTIVPGSASPALVPSGETVPAPAAALPVEARPLGSRYLLHDRLGRGATGEVWRARRRDDDREVAVKVLRPELADDHALVARFVQERSTLVGLAHPRLVAVHDLVVEGSTLAIVMDLVDGPDLRRWLRATGTPAPAVACALLAQLADGLAAVHRAGVVHRDLKPENVLLERVALDVGGGVDAGPDAGAGRLGVRLTDFGIARSPSGPALTRLEQLVGTPEYLAPELVEGATATPAADVYALGVVAYELVCGRRPFAGEHAATILRGHLDKLPPRPAGLDDALWALVADCLDKAPARRPTAAEVGERAEGLATTLVGVAPLARFVVDHVVDHVNDADADSSPSSSPSLVADHRGGDTGDDDGLPTVGGRRLPPADPPPAETPRRRMPWVLGGVGLVVGAALVGSLVAVLTAGGDDEGEAPPTTDPELVGILLETNVVAGEAPGTVTVSWESGDELPGFIGYQIQVVTDAGAEPGTVVDQVAAGSQARVITDLAPNPTCLVVSALLDPAAVEGTAIDSPTMASAQSCATPAAP